MTASSWPWVYKEGMSGNLDGGEDLRRKWFGIEAIKSTLKANGYGNEDKINLGTGRFGGETTIAVKALQKELFPGDKKEWDGVVGKKTANGLFHIVYAAAEQEAGVPRQLLRAHCHWESGDDPGAMLVNGDLSLDRGLTQSNNKHDSVLLPDSQAYDPAVAVPIRGHSIANYQRKFAGQSVQITDPDGNTRTYDDWDIAVSAHRTPLGAQQLAEEGDGDVVVAMRVQDGGTWEQAAAYYCWRIETSARTGWVG